MRTTSPILKRWRLKTACCVSIIALSVFGYAISAHSEKTPKDTSAAAQVETKSPIKHVIILIGENRGLDHTFGVYRPKGKGQTISNLLSKGIVKRGRLARTEFHICPGNSRWRRSRAWYFGAAEQCGPKTPYEHERQSDAAAQHQRRTDGAKQSIPRRAADQLRGIGRNRRRDRHRGRRPGPDDDRRHRLAD